MFRLSYLIIGIFLFISCSSGTPAQSSTSAQDTSVATTAAYDNTLAKGRVTNTVTCSAQKEQSYALYLPSYYTSAKAYPCIFFFDAHARGPLPLKMYKDLAEKYGLILIGSNVSKNGMQWNQASDIATVMMSDARSRINIDPKQIYVAGFSGGARVAGNLAIQNADIAGVISCAAGISTNQPLQRRFDYVGIVGTFDFNHNEMIHTDEMLEQNGFQHQLLTFNGKHTWPPTADFETAILWLQANAIIEKRQTQNDTIFSLLERNYEKQISAAGKAKDIIKEERLLAGLIKTVHDKAVDGTALIEELSKLKTTQEYKTALETQQQILQEEQNQQHALAQEFTLHDDKWWEAKIAELKHNSSKAKTQQEAQMYQRLINFLGLICYMNIDHALNINDISNVPGYLKVFKTADPQNPDYAYLSAIYYMKQNNSQQAIASLHAAASLGYDDITQLQANPAFASIKNEPGFVDVLNIVAKNIAH